ncbi:MAG: YIP1 family protein [Rhodobacteraceae bacterium]|nr:YIP1 family protein [Paracoccaceae bacterium]
MTPASFTDLLKLALQSMRQPRAVLRQILPMQVTIGQLLQIAFLFSVATLLLHILAEASVPDEGFQSLVTQLGGPVAFFALQFGTILIMAGVMAAAGRVFHGAGGFLECFKATIWLHFILLILQVIQLIVAFTAPLLALIFVPATLIFMMVLMVALVMEVHKFENTILVGFATIGIIFAVLLIVSAVLTALGFRPEIEAFSNV